VSLFVFGNLPAICRVALVAALLGVPSVLFSATPQTAAPDSIPTLMFHQFATGKPLRLVAYGDTRFTDPAITSGTNPRVRKWLAERVADEHPDVVLLTGDTPFMGTRASDWQDFQNETARWREAHMVQLPTTGNHERYGGDKEGIANYLINFPGIGGHRYYSALLGNVEVISLDCNSPSGASRPQARWFAAQLNHVPRQVDFLLILYHVPWMADRQSQLIAGLPSRDGLILRGILEARLSRIRAKVVVLNGHIHNYERFERRGVQYVVTGGGGAEPYPLVVRGESDLYRDLAFPVYHYLTIDVVNRQLHAVMWKVKDPEAQSLTVEAKDQFTITVPEATGSPATKNRRAPSQAAGKLAAASH